MNCPYGDRQMDVPWKHVGAESISRREFVKRAAMGAAAVSLLGGLPGCAESPVPPRTSQTNRFVRNGKALVVVVEGTDVGKMLEAGLDQLGGLSPSGGQKGVAIKPNSLSTEPYPVTTDPDLAFGLAQRLKDSGFEDITICDAPTTGMDKDSRFAGLGYFERGRQVGVKVIAGDASVRGQFVPVRNERWKSQEKIGVFRPLQEAPFVVNAVIPKRHDVSRWTCALKNHFGSVYGPPRWLAHTKASAGGAGLEYFDNTLVEFADAVRSELTIVDARSMLIKHGPTLTPKSEVKEGVNKLILCGDMVATDVYCADLMKEYDETFDPEMITSQLSYAEELGLGTMDKSKMEVVEISV